MIETWGREEETKINMNDIKKVSIGSVKMKAKFLLLSSQSFHWPEFSNYKFSRLMLTSGRNFVAKSSAFENCLETFNSE